MTTQARRRPIPARDPAAGHVLAALLTAGAATSGVVGAGHAAWLWAPADTARLRDLAPLALARRALEDHGLSTAGLLPSLFHVSFDLHAAGSAITFLAHALVMASLLGLVVALVASPAVLLVHALCRGLVTVRAVRWCFTTGLPVAATSLALVPGVWVWTAELSDHALYRGEFTRQILLYAALAMITVGAVFGRNGAAARRLLRLQTVTLGLSMPVALLVATLATWSGRTHVGRPQAPAGLPNVLLVSIDSLRADHLHCYGYRRDTSPRLDALAADGARFAHVVAPSPWTLPSHVTLLTGLPPEAHGVIDNGMRASLDTVFLAEALRAQGYETAGFVAGPYLDASFGFAQGFDHYDDYTVAAASNLGSHRGTSGAASVDLVIEWLDRRRPRGGRPFFVFLHLWDVHYDYTPPPPYDRRFDPGYRGHISAEGFETGAHIHAHMAPRDLAHIVALYDGEIAYTDHQLGRLLDVLAARELLDTTVIVVTADHGEEFFEHGRKGHQKALYDESLLVPLVVRYPPRIPAGVVVADQVRLMDVPFTVLRLAGATVPPGFGGDGPYPARDLGMLARGEAAGAAPPAVSSLFRGLASIRTVNAKWIAGPNALYDLDADPREEKNQAAKRPDLARALGAELRSWQEGWGAGTAAARPLRVSPDVERHLRALGYVE